MRPYRIKELVSRLKNRYGSFNALERETRRAGRIINRDRLGKLASADESEEVALNGAELRAIDKLLCEAKAENPSDKTWFDLSERAIFSRIGVMESLEATRKPVVFVLGSRSGKSFGERVSEIRSWDCRAMGILLGEFGRLQNVQVDFADCFPAKSMREAEAQDWHKHLAAEGASIVCIGSPRASSASEVILSQMFGVKPFEMPTRLPPHLPFYFVWSPEVRHNLISSSSLDGEELRKLGPDAKIVANQVKANRAWAMVFGKQIRPLLRGGANQHACGVIAAQRQKDGRLFVVLSGITGPATFAAAQMVKEMKEELPPPSDAGKPAPVLWGAITVPVTTARSKSHSGDARSVKHPKWLFPPRLLHSQPE